jgi:uncharacterized protein YdgA (DUF945 family)
MKNLLIALITLISVGLIAPKIIGGVVEKEHQSGVDKLNENPSITVNSTTFTRDWFSGKATTEMTIILQDDVLDDITIIVEEDLQFGPIIFTDENVNFALSFSQAAINFKELAIDEDIEEFIHNKIHLSGLLTFSKNIVSTIVIDEILKEVDGNKLTSKKAIGNFTLESNKLYGDFNWAGLTLIISDESFEIGGIKFSVDQTLIAGSYYQGNAISVGSFDFSMASLTAKDTTEVMAVDNILVSALSSVNNDLMTISMKYSAEKIASAGQQLENANLEVELNKLNINVMQEINTLTADLSGNGEEMFGSENIEKLSLLTAKLLVDQPVIEVKDLSVQTPEGSIQSSMKIEVDQSLFDTANIMSIIPAIKADANGNAPVSFFTKLGLSPMVDMYIEQGFILKKENDLSFNVNFMQGQLTVNGQLIPM